MSIDKESCDDSEPKTCGESRNKIMVENEYTYMTEAEGESKISLKSSKLSFKNQLDKEKAVANENRKTLGEHGDLYETPTSQCDRHIEPHPQMERKVKTCQITTKCVSIHNGLQKKNSDNENETLSSPSTVAISINDACVNVENGDSFTNRCEQSPLDSGESSCNSLSYSVTTTTITLNQINGRECIVNTDENSDDLENGHVFDDNSDNVESVCRICHCGEEVEALISPCLCIGSMRFVHHTCLMSWLQRSVKARCEICLHSFAVRRKTKAFKKWRLPDGKPIPLIWMVTFVCALTLNVASITKDASQRCTSNACIVFYVLGAIGALLGMVFFYHWFKKSLKYIQKWIALNEEWTLVGPKDLSKMGYTNPVVVSRKSVSETPSDDAEAGIV